MYAQCIAIFFLSYSYSFPPQGFLVPGFNLSRFSESSSDRLRSLVNSVSSSFQIHRSRSPFRDPTGLHQNAYHANEKYCIRHQSFCIYPIFSYFNIFFNCVFLIWALLILLWTDKRERASCDIPCTPRLLDELFQNYAVLNSWYLTKRKKKNNRNNYMSKA